MALGIAATVNSRNQRYTETQYEIGVAANQWTETYKDETESWTPSVIMESGSEYAVSESNSADFTGRYQSLNNYDVVKFYNENIKSLIANQTDVFLIENPDNGEFNITTPMVIEFSTGDMLELNDIPFFSKMRSPRSQKDCTLNRAGIWNTTDNV